MIIYVVIKISALLGLLLFAMKGPKKSKKVIPTGNSDLFVHEGGYLEYVKSNYTTQQEH